MSTVPTFTASPTSSGAARPVFARVTARAPFATALGALFVKTLVFFPSAIAFMAISFR
ncbi:hypothetical protein [Variovorax sp. OK605]|uniref:hypothetical protein n=1 Tax=Variovorax sp. OK605 TaxID=1855317 RepID=UPI0015A50B3F|nr:hypothetical protein [Variovorax sp. OK605]